jgi:hypothetical protein
MSLPAASGPPSSRLALTGSATSFSRYPRSELRTAASEDPVNSSSSSPMVVSSTLTMDPLKTGTTRMTLDFIFTAALAASRDSSQALPNSGLNLTGCPSGRLCLALVVASPRARVLLLEVCRDLMGPQVKPRSFGRPGTPPFFSSSAACSVCNG